MNNMGMAWVITGLFFIVFAAIFIRKLNLRQSLLVQALQREKEDLHAEIVRRREKEEFNDIQVEKMKETLYEIAETHDLDQERLTDLNLANEQLRIAIDETDSVNRSMSEFLDHLNHGIRMPASAIVELTDVMLSTQLTPEQRKNISIIKESAHSVLFLMDSRKDVLNVDSIGVELQKTYFSVESVMNSVIAILSPYTNKKGLDLLLRINHGIPPKLYGDDVRLRQIIIHLISNAIKFTQRGKIVVSVEAEPDGKDEAGAGNYGDDGVSLHFSVSDTGTGISEDMLDRISDSLHQTDGLSVRAFSEKGLELSITSKLARIMGGEIWVESKEGVGNIFHFTAAFTVPLELEQQNSLPRIMDAGRGSC